MSWLIHFSDNRRREKRHPLFRMLNNRGEILRMEWNRPGLIFDLSVSFLIVTGLLLVLPWERIASFFHIAMTKKAFFFDPAQEHPELSLFVSLVCLFSILLVFLVWWALLSIHYRASCCLTHSGYKGKLSSNTFFGEEFLTGDLRAYEVAGFPEPLYQSVLSGILQDQEQQLLPFDKIWLKNLRVTKEELASGLFLKDPAGYEVTEATLIYQIDERGRSKELAPEDLLTIRADSNDMLLFLQESKRQYKLSHSSWGFLCSVSEYCRFRDTGTIQKFLRIARMRACRIDPGKEREPLSSYFSGGHLAIDDKEVREALLAIEKHLEQWEIQETDGLAGVFYRNQNIKEYGISAVVRAQAKHLAWLCRDMEWPVHEENQEVMTAVKKELTDLEALMCRMDGILSDLSSGVVRSLAATGLKSIHKEKEAEEEKKFGLTDKAQTEASGQKKDAAETLEDVVEKFAEHSSIRDESVRQSLQSLMDSLAACLLVADKYPTCAGMPERLTVYVKQAYHLEADFQAMEDTANAGDFARVQKETRQAFRRLTKAADALYDEMCRMAQSDLSSEARALSQVLQLNGLVGNEDAPTENE